MLAVAPFDIAILKFINGFARHWPLLDKIVFMVSDDHLLKGGVLMLILWWLWFRNDESTRRNREHILVTLIACFFAILVSRILTHTLPFRPRPLYNESLGLVRPYGLSGTILEKWSSFPSDHASLFFALCTGFFFISFRVGMFSIIYTLLVICFPRVYLGLHYPSDILGGAIIGSGIAYLANMAFITNRVAGRTMPLIQTSPQFFYPVFFLITYQIADNFETSREVVSFLFK
jgi:undecaprenyl-diphosphatase